jgi:hypothetical protein
MAMRIAPPSPPPPDPADMMAAMGGAPPDAAPPTPEPEPDGDEGDQAGPSQKVDQGVVVYMDGSYGPFRCDHCQYFQGPSSCSVVDGTIDPAGCCNLYLPPGEGSDEESGETAPDDEAAELPAPTPEDVAGQEPPSGPPQS